MRVTATAECKANGESELDAYVSRVGNLLAFSRRSFRRHAHGERGELVHILRFSVRAGKAVGEPEIR